MNEQGWRWLLVLLAVLVLCSGCSFTWRLPALEAISSTESPTESPNAGMHFSDMTYVRPDLEELDALVQQVCTVLEHPESAADVQDAMDSFEEYYDRYDTMYNLADIHLSQDMKDTDWQEEYTFCAVSAGKLEESWETVMDALADCPISWGAHWFDYEQENPYRYSQQQEPAGPVDGALVRREGELTAQYQSELGELSGLEYHGPTYNRRVEEELIPILVELIGVRQKIAASQGYSSYESYAWDEYYNRDYTPQELADYMETIRIELAPLYHALWDSDDLRFVWVHSTEEKCEQYLSGAAQEMGGTVWQAYADMTSRGLYDITYGPFKSDGAFEVYLYSFDSPYLMMNPTGSIRDYLTFAHEFGHFCNDYAAHGSELSADVAELYSQGMEFLSVCYAPEQDSALLQHLRQLVLAECLSTFVEQSLYYTFERQAYSLQGEELTAENLTKLFQQISLDYGFEEEEFYPSEWAEVSHYVTTPMYIASYVVSSAAALELYGMETQEKGSGFAVYEKMLPVRRDQPVLRFLEEYGLANPMEDSEITRVAQILRRDLELSEDGATMQ